MRRGTFCSVAVGVIGSVILASAGAAQAQTDFPNRPITMVVPLPAGGTADLLCRFAADKASGVLGQQVVVENRPGGAGGRVGTESVLRAPPDGYTLLCAPQLTYSITHLVFSKASFDPRGMEPISVLAAYPLVLLVRPDLPAKSLGDLIAYARANPGKINYGHQGKGNTGHLLGELLMLKGNFRMTEIPYRGSAPAINDLLAGTIDIVPDYLLANKPNIDAGKLKILGTGGRERLKDYPKVAPFREKVTVFPEINPPLDAFCKVALRIARPPKEAVAGATVKVEGPACAVMAMVAVAELFVGSGSTADLFPTLTVLLSEAPFSRLALVAATIVMVSVSPLASEAYVMVWGFSSGLLLQTPPPVDAHETSKAPVGRLSTMVADVASGPLLVTVIV